MDALWQACFISLCEGICHCETAASPPERRLLLDVAPQPWTSQTLKLKEISLFAVQITLSGTQLQQQKTD